MKKFGLLLLGLLAATFVFAQDDEYGSTMDQPVRKPAEFAWEQVDVGEFSDPIPYAPIRQADVMYYYTIWRTIDLREKVNHPLYFPTETKGTWRSLAQTIFDAIDMANPDKTEGVLPVYADEMCTLPTSREDLRGNLSEISQIPEIDLETGEEIGMKELVVEYEPKQVISYNVKEIWYFDKQASKFYVQILEIEPIIEHERSTTSYDYDSEGESEDNDVRGTMMKKRVGYIYYPELRPFLAKQEVYNVKNNAQRLSYDDLITWKRDFTSYVYKEANVYDRDIADYIANSRDQRIESEKITDRLRTFESDLWEF